MNTKKNKNKNKGNKPPNPNPPQKEEKPTTAEKTENPSQENIELTKSEVRVPEIVSEVITLPVEVKVSEGDTPKKPKRNRGKKKNLEKEDLNEPKSSITESQKVEEVKASESKDNIVLAEHSADSVEVKQSEEICVTPIARKKKNKNKKHTDRPNEEETLKVEQLTENITGTENVAIDVTQEQPVVEIGEQEIKTSKKKNKKKKRNDSEKSGQSEEIVDCTSAFQKLLETKDNNVLESEKDSSSVLEEKSNIELGKETTGIETLETQTESLSEIGTSDTLKEESGKCKKKRKDKKQPPKSEDEVKSEEDYQVQSVPVLDLGDNESHKDYIKEENIKNVVETKEVLKEQKEESLPQIKCTDIEDKSPKCQAKIVKPVDKKRKGKSDLQTNDILPGPDPLLGVTPDFTSQVTAQHTIHQETTGTPTTSKATEAEPTEKIEIDIPAELPILKSDNIIMSEESVLPVKTENTHTTDWKVGKKGKKSSRQSKTSELSQLDETLELQTNVDPTKEALSFVEESPTQVITDKIKPLVEPCMRTDVSDTIMPDEIKIDTFEDKLTSHISSDKYILTTEPPPIVEAKTQLPVNLAIDEPSHILKTDLVPIPQAMGKKRKKSPRLSKTDEVVVIKESSEKEKESSKNVDIDVKSDKDDSPSYLPSLEDIEIRSIKADESEGSGCDIVPDIQYPRSSSQLLDNNNNMIIREIQIPESTKLNIPLCIPDTPLIQSSCEAVTINPGSSSLSQLPAINVSSEEKTDLKSKVMEVNKDMEDLRKSIEKSLAELTAIEKTDLEAEKQLEESREKIKIKPENPLPSDIIEHVMHETSRTKDEEFKVEIKMVESKDVVIEDKSKDLTTVTSPSPPPVCSSRKDKGKGKSKKKGKQDVGQNLSANTSSSTTTTPLQSSEPTTDTSKNSSQDGKKEEKTESKSEGTPQKGKQQSEATESQDAPSDDNVQMDFEPIENFEDAMTSSLDDVNKTFEMIVTDDDRNMDRNLQTTNQSKVEVNITPPIEDDETNKKEKTEKRENPVSQPKNLLGHPDIPVRLNKNDFKKEKNKTPNMRQAKVKLKDTVPIEINKDSKESQTDSKRRFLKDRKAMNVNETITCMTSENEEYVYKYSFRKVFLPNACHVCKKDLKQTRLPCNFCNLVFYCSPKHKDEDYGQHQALCFAVSTIVHLKNQKHIYADSKNIIGHNYRLLRMQMIVSCEKVLKRKLMPWEQESLLYPRMCADVTCREWRQARLADCAGCGQVSYCSDQPNHLPKTHQRWCKCYSLYQNLVCYQQTKGRLEPKLPSKVMTELVQMPELINEVLASMYEEKIDLNDIQYAALTQIATAPLTAVYAYQLYNNKMNSIYANGMNKKSSFTIHVVGAELQFEADVLNKWEIFFLHLRPDIRELRVVLIGQDLNPSKLPLNLLGKIKLCDNCRQSKRRIIFDFQDNKSYNEYWSSEFITPDLVCAFNPSIQRSSIYNGTDAWPAAIKCISKIKVPFLVTSYTLNELKNDLSRIKQCSEIDINVISEPKCNSFASMRPDRNFISDDEIPMLFKNYCYMVVCGSF